jgi:hypothetical protein
MVSGWLREELKLLQPSTNRVTIADHTGRTMTLKPIEAATPLDEEAINPELVKAIRWAKQFRPSDDPGRIQGMVGSLRSEEPAGQRASGAGLRCDCQQIAAISHSCGLR